MITSAGRRLLKRLNNSPPSVAQTPEGSFKTDPSESAQHCRECSEALPKFLPRCPAPAITKACGRNQSVAEVWRPHTDVFSISQWNSKIEPYKQSAIHVSTFEREVSDENSTEKENK